MSKSWWGLLAGLSISLQAQAIGALADVQIYDRNDGRTLPVIEHQGRYYVEGVPGHEYSLRIRNSSNERVLAVMSVDGVNVITGDTAAPAQTGYVLGSFVGTSIDGWRKSTSRTAAFYFTNLGDSYAARTGRPANVGVIGFALYREKQRPALSYEPLREKQAAGAASPIIPAPSAAASDNSAMQRKEERLGTGHGRSETSYVSYTSFERESSDPNETIVIYYDSRANLLAQGVPVEPRWVARPRPMPFPEWGRFAPDPR